MGSIAPQMDIMEKEDHFLAEIDLPGFDPNKISIEIEGDALIISGEKEISKDQKDGTYLRNERMSGSFYQRILFPSHAQLEKASCESKNGVLSLHIPKEKDSRRKSLQIKHSR